MAGGSPYDDLLMDHIRNARNFRLPGDADRCARGVNPLCGDEVVVYLRLQGERLADAAFQCTCCGISMASASMATETVGGLDLASALARTRAMIAVIAVRASPGAARHGEFALALVATVREFPSRAGCAVLPWLTLEAALEGRTEAMLAP